MRHLPLLFLILLYTGCMQNDSTADENGVIDEYSITPAFPDISFVRPVDLQQPNDNRDLLFVVEQHGVISVFEHDSSVTQTETFLDISGQVDNSHNEEGLLGLAFHPDYATNGYFYVNYTAGNPARTIISRFQVSGDDPFRADPDSEMEILTYEQPYGNHNGGQISFGPDGYLYIAVGDGGSGGDPHGHGQNRSTLLGTLLRIDVDQASGENRYGIPQDNPFVDNEEGYREEIYAWGLRNPWRFSFDPESGWLWTGDVGQNAYEEINIVEKGGNYGWNIMEATHCFEPATGCDESGLELPIWEYDRSRGDVSITGGFVYRGPSLPELTGQYIYADFASGRVWALDFSDLNQPENRELLQADTQISSFGVDQNQELYLCGFDGTIYKLEASSM